MRSIRCRRCKQMFEYEGLPPSSCPRCKLIEEADYQRVRSLVKAFPGISAAEVSQHTKVPFPTIMKYVENGGLEATSSAMNLDWIGKEEVANRNIKEFLDNYDKMQEEGDMRNKSILRFRENED